MLANKYRPKKLSELIGQEVNAKIIQNSISLNRIIQAYILTGTRGIGKTTLARLIAKVLNCNNYLQNNDACCICLSCIQIEQYNLEDLVEIDAASNTGIDNIRVIIDNAQYLPISAKYKVYIIDEVHMLSKAAFNAMLKILEEPPRHIIFILATTEFNKIPATIASRCLQLKLNTLSVKNIIDNLTIILNQENITFDIQALSIIATLSDGSMRDAIMYAEQIASFANYQSISVKDLAYILKIVDDDTICKIILAIAQQNKNFIAQFADQIKSYNYNLEYIFERMSSIIFLISQIQAKMPNIDIKEQNEKHSSSFQKNIEYGNSMLENISLPQELLSQIYRLSQMITPSNLQLYFEICLLGLEQIKKYNNKHIIFMMTLMRMLAFRFYNQDIVAEDDKLLKYTNQALDTTSQERSSNNKIITNTIDKQVIDIATEQQDTEQQSIKLDNHHGTLYSRQHTQVEFDSDHTSNDNNHAIPAIIDHQIQYDDYLNEIKKRFNVKITS